MKLQLIFLHIIYWSENKLVSEEQRSENSL